MYSFLLTYYYYYFFLSFISYPSLLSYQNSAESMNNSDNQPEKEELVDLIAVETRNLCYQHNNPLAQIPAPFPDNFHNFEGTMLEFQLVAQLTAPVKLAAFEVVLTGSLVSPTENNPSFRSPTEYYNVSLDRRNYHGNGILELEFIVIDIKYTCEELSEQLQ